MFARNPLRTWFSLALLLAAVSVAWVPPEPPIESRAPDLESVAASYLGPEIIISAGNSAEYSPAIAYNSVRNQYLVVWENGWDGGYHDVYAQRISGSGQLLSGFALTSASGHSQTNPDVAYDPVNDRYLVVWVQDSSGNGSNWDVYGSFVPWNGPTSALTEFPICSWSSNQGHPAVAYGRTQQEFMVVWKSESVGVPGYISARRVFASGGFPPSDGFTVSSGVQIRDFPDVAYNLASNEYLVTWDLEKTAHDIDIYGMRLRGDGIPLTGGDPNVTGEFVIAGWPDFEAAPAVAACDKADQYLVAWQSDQGTLGTDYAIYARYLNGDAVPGYVYMVDDTTSPELNVDVGCNLAGNQYLLAWQTRYTNLRYGIWARYARPDTSQSPQFAVKPAGSTTHREYPAVAGGRTGMLVAWEHQRDSDGNRDIHGRLLLYALYLPLVLR